MSLSFFFTKSTIMVSVINIVANSELFFCSFSMEWICDLNWLFIGKGAIELKITQGEFMAFFIANAEVL